jgi:hypothetical protein
MTRNARTVPIVQIGGDGMSFEICISRRSSIVFSDESGVGEEDDDFDKDEDDP